VFEKILVPLDGSENAARVLPWVRIYAARSETSVVLVQALAKVYPLEGMPFGARAHVASEYLERVRQELQADGVDASIRLPQNAAAESIVRTAEQEQCTLILMTTRGASKVVRWLIGGVTEQVIRLSPIPVLVIRSQVLAGKEPCPRRLLVPQDGSPRARRVLAWAERLARFHGVPLEILHVEAPHPRGFRKTPSRREASPKLAHWCSLLRRRGIDATYRLTRGDPASEILRDSLPSDLLVMTTHGYGGLKHVLLGSVAEKVIHGSDAPVFIYKHRSPRAAGTRSLVRDGNGSRRD